MSKVSFFDVDHTITRKSTGMRFASVAVKEGLIPINFFLSLPFYFLKYRFGGKDFTLPDNSGGFLEGESEETLKRLSDFCFNKFIMDDIFPEVAALIKKQQNEGVRIVLLSSSIDFLIEPLAAYLGIDESIATSFDFQDGLCTGKFLGKPVFGTEKKRRAMLYLDENGLKSENCSFYSDSFHDLPFLLEAGSPVTVNPDKKLYNYANKMGWQVLKFE